MFNIVLFIFCVNIVKVSFKLFFLGSIILSLVGKAEGLALVLISLEIFELISKPS